MVDDKGEDELADLVYNLRRVSDVLEAMIRELRAGFHELGKDIDEVPQIVQHELTEAWEKRIARIVEMARARLDQLRAGHLATNPFFSEPSELQSAREILEAFRYGIDQRDSQQFDAPPTIVAPPVVPSDKMMRDTEKHTTRWKVITTFNWTEAVLGALIATAFFLLGWLSHGH